MNTIDKVAVCSRSFSRNPILRAELLSRYKNVTFNDDGISLGGDGLVKFLLNHQKAIVALETIDDVVLSKLPQLKIISKYGVGLDSLNIEAISKYNIKLGWKGGVNRRSVSELVISFAIAMLRKIPIASKEVIDGKWNQHIGGLLSNKTIGIVGCGFIGKDLIELLEPWRCKILVNDLKVFPEFYDRYGIEAVSLNELLIRSDIVTLHVPLNSTTTNLISAEKIALMKAGAILINTARGGLVDEIALKKYLSNNKIAGAAFDVFLTEPPQDKELLLLPNFLVTPHIGGSAEEAILAMGRSAIDGLDINEVPNTLLNNEN